MRKIKRIVISLVLFSIFTGLYGCKATFIYPKQTDFSLTANVSNKILKVGEVLKVSTVFQNLTSNKYKISSGNAIFGDDSPSSLIGIYIFENKDKGEMSISDDLLTIRELKPNQKINRNREMKMEKKGKYQVLVVTNFDIINPENNEQKTYSFKVEPIIIEVK